MNDPVSIITLRLRVYRIDDHGSSKEVYRNTFDIDRSFSYIEFLSVMRLLYPSNYVIELSAI